MGENIKIEFKASDDTHVGYFGATFSSVDDPNKKIDIKAQNKDLIKVMKKFGDPNVDYAFTNAKLGNIFHVRFKNHELAAWFKLNKMIR